MNITVFVHQQSVPVYHIEVEGSWVRHCVVWLKMDVLTSEITSLVANSALITNHSTADDRFGWQPIVHTGPAMLARYRDTISALCLKPNCKQ